MPGPLSFDELQPGQSFAAGPRTLSRADIDAFTRLSGDRTGLHCDEAYARTTPFGGVVAHGALVLAAATGLAYDLGIFEGTVLAVQALTVRFDRPVFPGDELTLQLEVASRAPPSRADRGRVTFEITVRNQRGQPVLSGTWVLVMRRSQSPPPGPASVGRSSN